MQTQRGNTFFELLLTLLLLMSLQMGCAKLITYLTTATENLRATLHAEQLLNNFLREAHHNSETINENFPAWQAQIKTELPMAYGVLDEASSSLEIRWGLSQREPCQIISDRLKGCIKVTYDKNNWL